MLSRRRLLSRLTRAGFAGLVAASVAGCGSSGLPSPRGLVQGVFGQAQQATGTAPQPRLLTWVTPIPSLDVNATPVVGTAPDRLVLQGWDQMLGPWKATHPSITLVHQVVPAEKLTDQQLALAKSGAAVDVAYTDSGRDLGAAGALDPLDVSALGRKIVPAAFTPHTDQLQIYALPVFLSVLGLYVGHKRFQEAGIDPTTLLRDWQSFETAVQKLTDRPSQRYGFDVFGSGSPLSGQLRYGPFLWSAGGDFFDDAGASAIWNQSPGLEALIFLARLSQNYASAGAAKAADDVLLQNWLAGHTGALLAGPELTSVADNKELSYSIQSIPAYIQGQASSLATSAGANGIFAGSKQKDWALDFVHYLAGKDAQVAGLTYLRLVPANTDASDAAPVFQKNAALGQFLRILREDDVHAIPLARSHNPEIQAIFRVYWGIALEGLATPEAAWNKSVAQANQLLQQAPTPTGVRT
jgi:multiple sugar transport system substrate-binding protein